jgi:hypothetical protein
MNVQRVQKFQRGLGDDKDVIGKADHSATPGQLNEALDPVLPVGNL